jgi:predicted O-methyltransferase YrrM
LSLAPARVGLFRRRLKLWTRRLLDFFIRPKVNDFYRILGGYTFFQVLNSAVELDLFTLLARKGSLNRDEIATALGLETRATRVLLLGCTVLGLTKQRRGRYRNSFLAQRHLNRDNSRSIISMVRWQHHINYRPMFRLVDSLKANTNVGLEVFEGCGNTLFERLAAHPEFEAIFHQAMDEQSENVCEVLVDYVDFGRFRSITDVGGGNGAYLIQIAQAFPHIQGEVMDLPSVCDIARRNIAEAGLAAQLRVLPGDCFQMDFPSGSDCFLFAHFLTLWPEQRNKELLKKAYAALPSGGAAIIYNIMQEDSEDAPLSCAIGSAYFLNIATGQSLLWTWGEYCAWLREAGFRKIRRTRLTHDHGVIIAVK